MGIGERERGGGVIHELPLPLPGTEFATFNLVLRRKKYK
jgi:hypothetical protein